MFVKQFLTSQINTHRQFIRLIINKKLPSMTFSESVFNNSLLFPYISATASFLQYDPTQLTPFFVPGEESLQATSEQLMIGSKKYDNRKTYHADGIIRLHDLYDLEVLLLETSVCFENKDEKKISFDNVKGMFALLAMIKFVADRFSYAFVELFQKLKLYYIQASGRATHVEQEEQIKLTLEYRRISPFVVDSICKQRRIQLQSRGQNHNHGGQRKNLASSTPLW